MSGSSVGIWLVGAKGGVASTAAVGLMALAKGLVGPVGLTSELPEFQACGLLDWNCFRLGGHEIRDVRSYDEALRMHSQSRAIDKELIDACREELDALDERIRPGALYNVGSTIKGFAGEAAAKRDEPTPRAVIERLQDDLKAFVASEKLDHLIMVNLASTEPPEVDEPPARWADLALLLEKPGEHPLRASSLYAIAALELGYSYINFTPSRGSGAPAIDELARQRGACHMGCDGKTGETLMKSTLAPMFARRNLNVMSWVGHNIFGNMDGKVLDDPANKKAKVTSKDRLLGEIFGYQPQTLVSIEYIESMGDWKTAWDHIHFQGFLGTPMTLQFTWQGCDSLLAAPLVLDLARFTERAWRNGDEGALTFLAPFFKSPLKVDEHDFARQFQMLQAWAAGLN